MQTPVRFERNNEGLHESERHGTGLAHQNFFSIMIASNFFLAISHIVVYSILNCEEDIRSLQCSKYPGDGILLLKAKYQFCVKSENTWWDIFRQQ